MTGEALMTDDISLRISHISYLISHLSSLISNTAIMKQICPKCYSPNIFIFMDKKKKTENALCRSCFNKGSSDSFPLEDIEYWNWIDDSIKEAKINRAISEGRL